MNPVTIVIGATAIVFGIYTLYLRTKNPAKLGKLEAMQTRWGATAGVVVHMVAYSLLPILFGIVVLFVGFRGGSLF
jgi:hypothetical protein